MRNGYNLVKVYRTCPVTPSFVELIECADKNDNEYQECIRNLASQTKHFLTRFVIPSKTDYLGRGGENGFNNNLDVLSSHGNYNLHYNQHDKCR